ncbi:doublesex- and mab-3-related transcription factor A2-like [Cimex lectularius]|uniref:DMA domain-containing protein n=1 Tax=Cimex lectularius TaxID=79782 RepID=A0A8I6SF44_CIMLE|nr:doublesex- and mab-3-related transcription factor A2-like [Cimex lectularius]
MIAGVKRPRLSATGEDDIEGNEQDSEPKPRSPLQEQAIPLTPPEHPRPSLLQPKEESSESDGEIGPENLSLPKAYRGDSPPVVGVSTTAYHSYYPYTPPPPSVHRSPVDILLRVFPNRRRGDVEAALHRAKGDVLQAIELMVCTEGQMEEPARSAFSPLGVMSRSRRFLSGAPYGGGGYFPTVIRPQSEFHPHPTPIFPPEKPATSSPGSASDRTSYSE